MGNGHTKTMTRMFLKRNKLVKEVHTTRKNTHTIIRKKISLKGEEKLSQERNSLLLWSSVFIMF